MTFDVEHFPQLACSMMHGRSFDTQNDADLGNPNGTVGYPVRRRIRHADSGEQTGNYSPGISKTIQTEVGHINFD